MKLGPGQHIYLRATVNGKELIRPYTPIGPVEYEYLFDFIIKIYPQGLMSTYLDTLGYGDPVELKGPRGKFIYVHDLKTPRYCMVAAGTGITPILQIIRNIMKNPADRTQVDLIFANIAEHDILFKEEFDFYAKAHSDNFRVFYVIEKALQGWSGGIGYVTQEIVKERMKEDSFLLSCGPPGFSKVITDIAQKLGVPKEKYHRF